MNNWYSERFPTWDVLSVQQSYRPNVKMTSVSSGHLSGGAPRRNRTDDPILTIRVVLLL